MYGWVHTSSIKPLSIVLYCTYVVLPAEGMNIKDKTFDNLTEMAVHHSYNIVISSKSSIIKCGRLLLLLQVVFN